jgi:hypothetical protein
MAHDNTKSILNVPAVLTASEQELWASQWHGKPCPICSKGILKIGTKTKCCNTKGENMLQCVKVRFVIIAMTGFLSMILKSKKLG